MVETLYRDFKVPVSLINKDIEDFEVYIKVKGDTREEIENKAKDIFYTIDKYIEKAGINSNINDLYNLLFNKIEGFFTFKAKRKGLLAKNNLHLQLIGE